MNVPRSVDVALLSHNSGDACEVLFFFSLVSSEESFASTAHRTAPALTRLTAPQ